MDGINEVEKGVFLGGQRVVMASHNAGKVRELGAALSELGWDLVGMTELGLAVPDETGTTFEANAVLKAEAATRATGLWALADDSGLEVDALGGKPGVDTAHFGGWQKLLEVMAHLQDAPRTARFVCVLALCGPGGEVFTFRGISEGVITREAYGEGGFGYDPVFMPEGAAQTYAAMTQQEKAALSHRGKAVALMAEWAKAGQRG